jgi:ComF family protein
VRWAEHFAASVFFALFPANCRICSSPLLKVSRLPVCADCLSSIHPLNGPLCTVCGEGLYYATFSGQVPNHLPARCRFCEQLRPPFEHAFAHGSYEAALRELIHLLKFEEVRPAARVLGKLLAESIGGLNASLPAGVMAVVPVPLHAQKRAQRGFNQADMIARVALKRLAQQGMGKNRFELRPGALVRVRDTGSQIGLTRHQRQRNLRGAFAVVDATSIGNRDVLVLDDVYTTGATASECARVLLRGGAKSVWVATVGRTMRYPIADPQMEPSNLSGDGNRAEDDGWAAEDGFEAKPAVSVGIRAQG